MLLLIDCGCATSRGLLLANAMACKFLVSFRLLWHLSRTPMKNKRCLLLRPLMINRAAASTWVLASTRLQNYLSIFLLLKYSSNSTPSCKISTSGFNFCKLNYWFVAICAHLDFVICILISFNSQLHYNKNETKHCTTMLTKTNNQKKKEYKTIDDIG